MSIEELYIKVKLKISENLVDDSIIFTLIDQNKSKQREWITKYSLRKGEIGAELEFLMENNLIVKVADFDAYFLSFEAIWDIEKPDDAQIKKIFKSKFPSFEEKQLNYSEIIAAILLLGLRAFSHEKRLIISSEQIKEKKAAEVVRLIETALVPSKNKGDKFIKGSRKDVKTAFRYLNNLSNKTGGIYKTNSKSKGYFLDLLNDDKQVDEIKCEYVLDKIINSDEILKPIEKGKLLNLLRDIYDRYHHIFGIDMDGNSDYIIEKCMINL